MHCMSSDLDGLAAGMRSQWGWRNIPRPGRALFPEMKQSFQQFFPNTCSPLPNSTKKTGVQNGFKAEGNS